MRFGSAVRATRTALPCLALLVTFFAATAHVLAQPTLPAPNGVHRVGTRVLTPLVDKSRPDERFPNGSRCIPVQLWYPTEERDGARSPYVVDSKLLDALKVRSSRPETVESWRTMRTHAVLNASPAKGRFPLVTFSPGFGMPRAYYTAWLQELASHGLVVAAIDHPFAGETWIDGTFFSSAPHPDGPLGQTTAMANDVRLVVSSLKGVAYVDAHKVATIGHSIGGAAAIDAALLDPAIVAAVNLDGDPSFGRFANRDVHRPFLVIHQKPLFPASKPGGRLFEMGRKLEQAWQEIIASQSAPVLRLQVRGTAHFSFTDALFTRLDMLLEGSAVVSDPLLVLRGTTAVIVDYLRNSFAGRPSTRKPLPPIIKAASLGSPE